MPNRANIAIVTDCFQKKSFVRSASIFRQTTGSGIYTVSKELIGLPEIQYPVFGIQEMGLLMLYRG